MPETSVWVDPRRLSDFVATLFTTVQIPVQEAELIADTLVDANLAGVDAHGVIQVPTYIEGVQSGQICPATRLIWIQDRGAVCVLDAGNGWGQTAALAAMERAIEKARGYGAGVVLVRNSNPIGTRGYWARIAAEQGCIGLVITDFKAAMGFSPAKNVEDPCISGETVGMKRGDEIQLFVALHIDSLVASTLAPSSVLYDWIQDQVRTALGLDSSNEQREDVQGPLTEPNRWVRGYEGIPLVKATYDKLRELARQHQIPFLI
ncbi:Ldh family oxidoreductase [Alicyclobacillus tolerans]|uniref:Ldh family oxidoreductase n=1 Tax=Alicyclobacillus tolerans TaxID=90970 RepID=UPI001F23DC6A|nr:Ldh family oxidoreductase [Alicyclobacillus tolerans]MCF8564312.1 Ldh family oxidoreductase [Alicyclobacillus tolerans]